MDAIRMQGIVKCFGPVRANDGIDFTVERQEIHCLLYRKRLIIVKEGDMM